jgi:hypothetical protein
MYRNCIFCSAALGSNDSLERFPVGRSLAFDGEKGRLWAVCPKCARWNLAPIEERWEAIEDAERLFRDTRLRVQRENIGLAKLADGTRLIRVGEALAGELAAWRYGETLVQRRRGAALSGGAVALVGGVGALAGVAGAGISLVGGVLIYRTVHHLWRQRREYRVVHRFSPGVDGGESFTVRRRDLEGARLTEVGDGLIGIRFPDPWEPRGPRRRMEPFAYIPHIPPLVLTGAPARTLLARAMVHVNDQGARPAAVDAALRHLAAEGSPADFLRAAARGERSLVSEPTSSLALEMALHEETERRALEGELAMLEGMWREAEGIAAIADRLPDLPAPEPPRLAARG